MSGETNRFADILAEARMSVTTKYADVAPIIKVGDAVVGTLGNFSTSTGKAKSKKTFNVSAIVASALCGRTILKYSVKLPLDKQYILYVDTEQGKGHYQKVIKRIYRLAGMSTDIDCDRIIHYSLRKYNPADRLGAVEYAINTMPGIGLVIIDGIRDLLYDINSPTEATNIVSLLMRWTDEHQLHLHTILHQNKSDDNARGHIGTELNNKAETVLQVEKDKDDSSISKVEAVHCRDREFEPFAFRINDDALPELVDDYIFKSGNSRANGQKFDPYKDITKEQHLAALSHIFTEHSPELSRGALEIAAKEAYAEVFIPLGDNKIKQILTMLSNKRIIIHKDENNQKSPFILNPEGHY